MRMHFDVPPDHPEFWESRYRANRTVWDLGGAAPALCRWLEQPQRHTGQAMVLGCGRGYDAIALAACGYEVTAVDFAPSAIRDATRLAEAEGRHVRLLERDIFALEPELDQAFDLVFEHTLFCVLEPERRDAYRDLVARLLKPGGLLLGIFFTGLDPEGPPFGVTPGALEALFRPQFECLRLERLETSQAHAFDEEHLGLFRRL